MRWAQQAIKATVDQVIKIVTNPNLQGKARQAQKFKLLKKTIFPRFDFREMAKSSMGLIGGISHLRNGTSLSCYLRIC
jgi:ABC-type transporter MlaC component